MGRRSLLHDRCEDVRRLRHEGVAYNVGFKCDPERFLELTDQAGIIPAPYLARAHWVLVEQPQALTDAQATALVRRSYELIVAKLSKRRQRELLG